MINTADILETIHMIREENLDIRTVTMGISLYDCVSDDIDRLCANVYDKIMSSAKNLVSCCEGIEKLYGIHYVIPESATFATAIGAGLCSLRQKSVK
jgi:uncharacterized protein (UPF0210 family)